MRRILWLTSADEDARVLVFSSWNDVLDVLEHALLMNSVHYVRMKGGRFNPLFFFQIINLHVFMINR